MRRGPIRAGGGPGPRDQVDGSFERYDAFWNTIEAVAVNSTTASGKDGVEVSLTYTSKDGTVEDETRLLTVAKTDNGLLIVGDQVI